MKVPSKTKRLKRGRPRREAPSSRPPLERMMLIHQSVQAGQYPNSTQLAARLEVSIKSIHRDVEFMRDRLGLPLSYDEVRHGFYYMEEVAAFPTLQVSEGELVALLVAEKALQQYRGTHFEKPLLSAFKKIAAGLPNTISVQLADWDQTISFRTSASPTMDILILDTLARAASKREQLRIAYRKPGKNQVDQRIIDPYHLANVNGEWYLFAHDHLRNDLRTFVPGRIRNAIPTGRHFVRPSAFSLERVLRDSFNIHSGTGEHLVVIRFTPLVADYVREKRWHTSQMLKELPDGGVELRMSLSSLGEVERWILGWGGQAQAIEPPELKIRIRQAAVNLAASHA